MGLPAFLHLVHCAERADSQHLKSLSRNFPTIKVIGPPVGCSVRQESQKCPTITLCTNCLSEPFFPPWCSLQFLTLTRGVVTLNRLHVHIFAVRPAHYGINRASERKDTLRDSLCYAFLQEQKAWRSHILKRPRCSWILFIMIHGCMSTAANTNIKPDAPISCFTIIYLWMNILQLH